MPAALLWVLGLLRRVLGVLRRVLGVLRVRPMLSRWDTRRSVLLIVARPGVLRSDLSLSSLSSARHHWVALIIPTP